MDQQKKEDLFRQLGCLMRFANKMNNNHPELVNDSIRVAIEKSRVIISENSNIKNSEILKPS